MTRQVLVTADSDQIPTVKHIREAAPGTRVILAAPPGREHVARGLGQHVHDRQPLTLGRLFTCMLPQVIRDDRDRLVAQMPALYQPDES